MLGKSNRDRVSERRSATRSEILAAAWDIARERGLATMTLRDVADRVGMRPPSLYSYIASKNELYDAMFGQAWNECLIAMTECAERLPDTPRGALRSVAATFFDFCVEDLARHQLMNQRIISDFQPSAESYAPSVQALDLLRNVLNDLGVHDAPSVDLAVALVGGLIDAQFANDPGGDRWRRLLDRAVDMYADNVGL
nr:TetR/AcrR family transcriptional regulator [Rhodococcus sp. SMB37]